MINKKEVEAIKELMRATNPKSVVNGPPNEELLLTWFIIRDGLARICRDSPKFDEDKFYTGCDW